MGLGYCAGAGRGAGLLRRRRAWGWVTAPAQGMGLGYCAGAGRGAGLLRRRRAWAWVSAPAQGVGLGFCAGAGRGAGRRRAWPGGGYCPPAQGMALGLLRRRRAWPRSCCFVAGHGPAVLFPSLGMAPQCCFVAGHGPAPLFRRWAWGCGAASSQGMAPRHCFVAALLDCQCHGGSGDTAYCHYYILRTGGRVRRHHDIDLGHSCQSRRDACE